MRVHCDTSIVTQDLFRHLRDDTMSKDESLLLDYTRFVDEVTSDASKDAEAFTDAIDIIDEQGVSRT